MKYHIYNIIHAYYILTPQYRGRILKSKTFYNISVVFFIQILFISVPGIFYFCYMDIEIGNIIKRELEKTGWSISQFAQKIRRDRSIVYHIFKRKVFDTDLLYDISMALNIDLFKYYSEALEKNNEMIRLHKAKDEQKIVRKRKIFLEVEVSEDEYQAFMKQTK